MFANDKVSLLDKSFWQCHYSAEGDFQVDINISPWKTILWIATLALVSSFQIELSHSWWQNGLVLSLVIKIFIVSSWYLAFPWSIILPIWACLFSFCFLGILPSSIFPHANPVRVKCIKANAFWILTSGNFILPAEFVW